MADSQCKCRVCLTDLGTAVLSYSSLPIAGVYSGSVEAASETFAPFNLFICDACGLVQIEDSVSKDFYNDYTYAGSVSSAYKSYLYGFAEYCLSISSEESSVLEIGSGDGLLLSCLDNYFKGEITGIEPSQYSGRDSTSSATVLNAYFTPEMVRQFDLTPYDLIISRHVLEHINDLHSFFKALELVSHKDTILILEVPDLTPAIEESQFGNFYHSHLNYFDINSLSNLLKSHDWKITNSCTNEIFGGSLVVSVSKTARSSVNTTFGKITPKVLDSRQIKEFFENFPKLINEFRERFLQLIKGDEVIAAYGAAERTIALIGFAGLTNLTFSSVFDMNKNIHGKYLPGLSVPVASPEQLIKERSEIIIIFASSNETEIVEYIKNTLSSSPKMLGVKGHLPYFIT